MTFMKPLNIIATCAAFGFLGAIIFNILVFHTLMAPEGFPPALVFTALELFLIWRYREAFMPLLRP